VLVKHKNQESMGLLLHSAMMLNESRVLPERDKHDKFEITAEDFAKSSDEIDLNGIPCPTVWDNVWLIPRFKKTGSSEP